MIRLRSGFDTALGRRAFLGSVAAGGVALSCGEVSDDPIPRVRTIQGHPGERLDLTATVGMAGWGRRGTAMDPDNLYFLRKDGLYSVVRTGGPARKLADMGGKFPCVGGDFVYWVGDVTPTTQAVVRASRFGSSVEKLFDLQPGPVRFSAMDGRVVWEDEKERKVFTARPGGNVVAVERTLPDDFIARPGGLYWENIRSPGLTRLARDGSVSEFASWREGHSLFDIDDDYAYGTDRVPTAPDRYRWFRRPRGGGRDEQFEVEGAPVAAWSAGKRVLVGAGRQGEAGVHLTLYTPGTGSSVDLFTIDSYQRAVVDEWGIFWMDGSENIQSMTNTYRFYYYEFPLPS